MCYIPSPLSFRALRPLLYLCPRHPLLLDGPCTVLLLSTAHAQSVYTTHGSALDDPGIVGRCIYFFLLPMFFPALIICPWRFRSEDFHLVRTRPLSPQKNTPLCVHTSMAGSSLSSPDKDNACQLGPPGPWYSPITICCIDISATFDSISYVVAGSAVTYQSV
jgi:hypothetical protein